MSKIYPVVLYPKQILKFLVQNHSSGSYHAQPSPNRRYKARKQPFTSHLRDLRNWLYLLLAIISTLIALSLAFLSPFWLVATIWGMILLGIFAILSLDIPTSHEKAGGQGAGSRGDSPGSLAGRVSTKDEREQGVPPVSSSPYPMPPAYNQAQQLSSLISGSVMASIGTGTAPVGVSEKDFKKVLQQFFPNIVQGLQFQNPALSFPYSADFVFIHSSGLSIDIEIDEPYVGNTKQPHHCLDQNKDDIRNNFFNSGNWVVIRFSEKQVVQYSKSCCKVIAAVIAQVANDYTYLKQFTNIPDLPVDPRWTIRQAKKWAKQNYRKTYLENNNLATRTQDLE